MLVIRVAGPPFKLENVFLKRQDTAIGALASGGGVTHNIMRWLVRGW